MEKETALSKDELIKQLPMEFNDAQRVLLTGITPAKYIKSRQGAGGKTFTYVTTGYVVEMLNKVFGFNWDFNLHDQGITDREVWVRGELVVRTPNYTIRKSQYGSSAFRVGGDTGDTLKAASSDCLKKCASLVGVASDIYYPKEIE